MKHAIRSLAKSPGFTSVALLTLALGIGLNSSMFSVLNTVLFHALPYPESDELIRVYRTSSTLQTGPLSPANFLDLHDQNQSFAHLAAIEGTGYNLAPPGQPARRLQGMNVTADFFSVLGMAPSLGRVFTHEEDVPGRDDVVVLSHPFWQSEFAADPHIVGKAMRLDGQNVTVIGVMPPGFEDPLLWGPLHAWRPMAWNADERRIRGSNWLRVIGRLKPGISGPAAQAEMNALATLIATASPGTDAQAGLTIDSLLRSTQDPTMRMFSWFTMGLAGCVLLIACANLASLQFARNALRTREHAVRAALGASRFQLIRHSLTESLILAMMGGALGIIVALWANDYLGPRINFAGTGLEIPLNLRVLGFTFAMAAGAGVGFGLLPAWLAARADVNDALKQSGRASTGGRAQHRIRHALIVSEVALALTLLSSAGFFLRALDRFSQRDLGWQTDHLLTASITLPASRYATDEAQRSFYDQLETRLATQPGVETVALSRSVPFNGFNFNQRLIVEGQPEPASGAELVRQVNGVSVGFFDTLGLTLLEGRTFTIADQSGPMRTVINEAMAKQLWPNESAVGKRIAHPVDREWQEVIGVVRDIHFATNLGEPRTSFQTYRLLGREPFRSFIITLRSALPPERLAEAVRRTVAEIDPELPVQDIRSAHQTIERGLANFHLVGALLAAFAALGLFLAAIGIYGVVAGFVAQRTNEIGVRMALGAQLHDILRLVLGQGLKLALLGSALGLVGAWVIARLLNSIAPALPAAELTTAAVVTATLIIVALLACWIPARRAARVDPLIALRAE